MPHSGQTAREAHAKLMQSHPSPPNRGLGKGRATFGTGATTTAATPSFGFGAANAAPPAAAATTFAFGKGATTTAAKPSFGFGAAYPAPSAVAAAQPAATAGPAWAPVVGKPCGAAMGFGVAATGVPVGIGLGKGRQVDLQSKRCKKVLRDNLQGITRAAIKRLMYRAGGMRMSGMMYEEVRATIRSFLDAILQDSISLCELHRKRALSAEHVIEALRLNGINLYGY